MPMIRKALQLFVFGFIIRVGEPVQALSVAATDPCYTYCEGVKVGFRSIMRHTAMSSSGSVPPSMNTSWEGRHTLGHTYCICHSK